MSDSHSNPYQSPKEGTDILIPTEPLRPPITSVRLVLGLVLVTIAWSGIWAKVREGIFLGFFVSMLCFVALPWVLDPSAAKRNVKNASIKPWVIVLNVVLVVPLVYLLKSEDGTTERRWLDEVVSHPVALIGGWLFSCGVLMIAWWKRRNNPPYQPELSSR